MTLEQKRLFDKWLAEAEEALESRLEGIKSLRKQLKDKNTEIIPPLKSKSKKLEAEYQSWTSKTLNTLKQLGGAQTSTAIITWLMDENMELKSKGKRYVTKNVTSKLSLLVDKGLIEKKILDGKNVYILKNQD